MDLQSYIQLKEAYANVHAPREEVIIEVTNEEVDFFIDALLEEGYDLSEFTREEIQEAYLVEVEKGLFGLERMGGQIRRGFAKTFGNASQRNNAISWENSKNNIDKRRGQNAQSSTATQGEIDAETAGRRRADPNYKPGQGVGSGQPLSANKPVEKKKPENNGGNGGGGNGGGGNGGGGTQKVQPKPQARGGASDPRNKAYVAAREKANAKGATAGDKAAAKKTGMDAWAKANPELAKAKAKRDSTRGTSATTNPLMNDLKRRMPKPAAPKSTSGASAIGKAATSPNSTTKPTPKPTAPTAKPVAAAKPTASVTGNKASSFMNKSASNALSKPMKEESDFDIILTHLIEQGFGDDEALTLMVNMSEEKRVEILENRRAARAAGGYKDDSKKQTDPSKDGFTGISGSIKDVMKQSAAMDKKKKTQKEGVEDNFNRQGDKDSDRTRAWMKKNGMSGAPGLDAMAARKKEHEEGRGKKKQKTQKEEVDSLYQAYLSMVSEEESDKRKDEHQERGGHAARTDYSKPPTYDRNRKPFGKKPDLTGEEREAAMAKIVAGIKKKGGKSTNEEVESIIWHLIDEGFASDSMSAEAIVLNMSDEWLDNLIREFVPAPAGSPIDRHSRGISKYDKRSERQIRMDNFASKRTKMMNQPKTP